MQKVYCNKLLDTLIEYVNTNTNKKLVKNYVMKIECKSINEIRELIINKKPIEFVLIKNNTCLFLIKNKDKVCSNLILSSLSIWDLVILQLI